MKRMAGLLVLLVVVVVVVVVVAACSSAADTAAPRSSDPADSASTALDPTTAPATTTPLETKVTDPVAPEQARVLVTETGVVVPVLDYRDGAYQVHTPCGLDASIVGGAGLAVADVVLDPGHGGDEQGAIGANGLQEKDVNLDVARLVRDRLEEDGYRVVLTRTDDYRVTLATRAEVATALGARAFVSVHHNAVADGPHDGPGSEAYYQLASSESRRLAGLVYEEVVGAFDRYEVAWEGDRDAGAKFRRSADGGDYYGILRRSAGIPGVLSEAAYLSNPTEAELLADEDVRRAEAAAIAAAVVRFLTTDDAGSGFVEPYARTDAAGPGGGAAGCVDPPL